MKQEEKEFVHEMLAAFFTFLAILFLILIPLILIFAKIISPFMGALLMCAGGIISFFILQTLK